MIFKIKAIKLIQPIAQKYTGKDSLLDVFRQFISNLITVLAYIITVMNKRNKNGVIVLLFFELCLRFARFIEKQIGFSFNIDQYLGYVIAKKITGPYTFHGPIIFNKQPIYKWDMGTFQDKDGIN